MALLSDDDIDSKLEELDGWERAGEAIRRAFTFDDFVGSIQFANRLVEPAEDMNHHPDLEVSWNRVTVSLTTHSQGGLTDSDFELARRIEAVA